MTLTYTTPSFQHLTGNMRTAVLTQSFADSPISTAVLGYGTLLDIAKAPHVLVAGTTGSGKSCLLHDILASLLLRNVPGEASFLIIDPKMVEFEYFYRDHPMLYRPIVTEPREAIRALEDACDEMMQRYDYDRQNGIRFWQGAKLYIIIDEIADLVSAGGKRLEKAIEKLARLGRGAGIHLIVATQHPTSDVLSRQITTNLDTRICLRVNDYQASRLVLGVSGGEKLNGKGDAIIRFNGEYKHFQACYISDEELEAFAHGYEITSTDSATPVSKDPCATMTATSL